MAAAGQEAVEAVALAFGRSTHKAMLESDRRDARAALAFINDALRDDGCVGNAIREALDLMWEHGDDRAALGRRLVSP